MHGTRVSHLWDTATLRLREVISSRVVVERLITFEAEAAQVGDDAFLLLGRDVIVPIAVAVVMRAAAKEAEEPMANDRVPACAAGGQQTRHAACDAHGFFGGKEGAVVALTGGRQDRGVMGEVGRCQLCHGIAEARVLHGAVALKTDGPVVGRKGVSKCHG